MVNYAARIVASFKPAEIWVSQVARDDVESQRPGAYVWAEQEHQFAGFTGPQRVYAWKGVKASPSSVT